jgi:hypothetical protein
MRRMLFAIAVVAFGCGTRKVEAVVAGGSGSTVQDAGTMVADASVEAPDAAVESPDGSAAPADAGLIDAGPIDAGTTSGAGPIVPTLEIVPEPGSTCASWLPSPPPPSDDVPDGGWTALSTDDIGDLAAIDIESGTWTVSVLHVFPGDGGTPHTVAGNVRALTPIPNGFMFERMDYGPCMICSTYLESWPTALSYSSWVFIGDPYPWHGNRSYAVRPGGGVYASYWAAPFMGDTYTFKFEERDEALQLVSQTDGISPHVTAVDRLDVAIESLDAGVRWIDGAGNPLSAIFDAKSDDAFPLIGGGLLTTDDHVVASGRSDVRPAPDWMRGRAANAYVVFGEGGYAFSDASCDVHVYSAGGELCGTLRFPGCTAPPQFGLDGTAIVKGSGGAWGLWRGLRRLAVASHELTAAL